MNDAILKTPENAAQSAVQTFAYKVAVEDVMRKLQATGACGVVVIAAFPDGSACQMPGGKVTAAALKFMVDAGLHDLVKAYENALAASARMAAKPH